MLKKEITAFRQKQIIACDGKCEKAFGYNGRASIQLSEDEDDICWLSDNEVGIAPESGKTVITAEGGECKPNPANPESLLNKWCYRECERCVCVGIGEAIKLPDFSQRKHNMSTKHGISTQ